MSAEALEWLDAWWWTACDGGGFGGGAEGRVGGGTAGQGKARRGREGRCFSYVTLLEEQAEAQGWAGALRMEAGRWPLHSEASTAAGVSQHPAGQGKGFAHQEVPCTRTAHHCCRCVCLRCFACMHGCMCVRGGGCLTSSDSSPLCSRLLVRTDEMLPEATAMASCGQGAVPGGGAVRCPVLRARVNGWGWEGCGVLGACLCCACQA